MNDHVQVLDTAVGVVAETKEEARTINITLVTMQNSHVGFTLGISCSQSYRCLAQDIYGPSRLCGRG